MKRSHQFCPTCKQTQKKLQMATTELVEFRQVTMDAAIRVCRADGHDPFASRRRRPLWYYSLPRPVRRYFQFCRAAKAHPHPLEERHGNQDP